MIFAFRLALPLLLALSLHAIPRLAFPLSSGAYPEKVPTTDISTHALSGSKEQTTSTDTPLTSLTTPNAPYNITGPREYIFRVQDSDVVLIIRLGKPVEKGALASFLEVAKDHVEQQAAGYGPNQLLPSGMFEWDLGERLEIDAKTSPALIAPMTWSIFVDAIGGLREFLVGLKSGREAACRVMIGDAFGLFAGYVELRTRVPAPKAHIARDVPILPVVNDPKLIAPPLHIGEDVQIDLRPQRQRLEYQAVRNVLAVTRDWVMENIERSGREMTIMHGGFERSLAEGVKISMVQAPGKRLTYGLVLETVDKLFIWEMFVSRGKAVEFGILEQGALKGVGSIKKAFMNSVDAAR
ncbi:MAG: hypothetical protein LQ343_003243 [Gyalolechia ehrenbergii]|nr:MAG: hypothetical protein LQ343_003243 [Gyalolechia ehrenbergii]